MRQKLRNRNKYVRFISHEKCKILSIFPTFFKPLSNFVQIECLARYTFFPFISLISMEDNHPCRKHEYKYAIFPSLIFTMVERVRGKYRKKNANWHLSSDGVALSSKFHRIYRAERTTMNRLYKPWISKRPNFSRIIGTNLSRKTNLGRMITARTGRVAKYHCWFEYTCF